MPEVIIDKATFLRMSKALIEVEQFLQINTTDTWVNEETALKLLGCKRAKLYELKASGQIRFKRVGKMNQYSKKSIDKYNLKFSS